MVRYFMVGMMIVGTSVALPLPAMAQSETSAAQQASSEDPNDKAPQDRSFEETRKHMQAHSEWSKKTGKMNDN
jgi:hypothetical protein